MKQLLLSIWILGMTFGLCHGDSIPSGAVNYFANKYGHDDPDTARVVAVNFRDDSSQQYLMTFAKGDWKGPEAVWVVIENQNNQWTEPKTLDFGGKLNNFSAMQFDPSDASFVYLPSYKRRGLLAHWKEAWTFTYLNGDTLQTAYFWTASQAGLTKEGLNKLMEDHKLVIKQVSVQ